MMKTSTSHTSRLARAVALLSACALLAAVGPIDGFGQTKLAKKGTEPGQPNVVAEGYTDLTEEMIRDMADALSRATNAPFTNSEYTRLKARATGDWKKGGGYRTSVIEAHDRLLKLLRKNATFPRAAQPAAWAQTMKLLWNETRAAPETFLAESVQRAALMANEPLIDGDIRLRKNAAQAYFEMRDALEDLTAEHERLPSPAEVLRGGGVVAQAFPKFTLAERDFVSKADIVWAHVRPRWSALGQPEKDALRKRVADLGARDNARDTFGYLTPSAVRELLSGAGLLKPSEAVFWPLPELQSEPGR